MEDVTNALVKICGLEMVKSVYVHFSVVDEILQTLDTENRYVCRGLNILE